MVKRKHREFRRAQGAKSGEPSDEGAMGREAIKERREQIREQKHVKGRGARRSLQAIARALVVGIIP
jgi:hypothetical protein